MVRLLLLLLVCGDFTVSDRYVIAERGIQQVAARVAEQEEPPSHGEYYVVMFTAKWCSVCQVYKNAGRWDRVLDVFPRSVVVDLDVEPRWARAGVLPAVRSLPTFWLLNSNDTTKVLKVWQGPTDAAEFKRKIEKLQPIVTPAVNAVDAPERYIQWPGWGTIDLETYARDCNCPMCVSIRQMQADYWARKSQAAVTPDKEGCPHAVVERMLDDMRLLPRDTLGDLGCGDGRILIAAAKRGIRGIGVEIDPARADVARANVAAAGFSDMITIETGDARDFDMSRVTAVTAFLYPELLAELSSKMMEARVAASPYHEVPGFTRDGDIWFHRGVLK